MASSLSLLLRRLQTRVRLIPALPQRSQGQRWLGVGLMMTLLVGGLVWRLPMGARAAGTISLTTLGSAYTQNFDTLASTGTSSTVPTGWDFSESLTNANTTYTANNGGSNTGETYSYGTTGSTERAFGQLRSSNLASILGASFTNNTGSTITSLDIAYTGEQWRFGAVHSPNPDRMDFQYSTDATSLTTGTWTDVNALDFNPPITTGTVGALDGNLAANRVVLSATISSLNIPNGAVFWIRWTDADASSSDDGLAIDNFSLTPLNTPPPPNLTINDVSLNEGNAGTTSFTFTVSLSAPAGPGGVTFDIATADGTATQPSDYTQKSLTGQTIPAGSSTYSFTVLVNGDTTPETNETFFVNVTNVTGATVTDGQGQGTIVNDDVAPNLTINDVTLNEGNAGTTTFTFTVSLSAPAGAGGVTFDIATADGTATQPSDYTQKSLTSQTIPAGSSTYTFDVLVNGDTTPETDETFFVNVTNVTNAIVTDGQGQGTIVNDDITKIHDVQGNGAATPIPGATVTIEGVVIANFQGTSKLRGFFLQEEDADADADPATSEGIFVFCNSCPTSVAEGQRVKATGTVSEFNNMTEITASTAGSVVVTDAGNHLAEVTPAPISLPIVGDINTFYETLEGMLVTFVDTLTVSEYSDLARFGQLELFQGGRPRQFTEMSPPSVAGYSVHLDNLNRRRVILDDDNNAQNAYLNFPDGFQSVFYPQANGGFSVGTQGIDFFRGGDLVNGLTGVLHWSFPGSGADTWRIRPTTAHPVTFTVANPRPVTPPTVGGAIKVVSMNLLNYFTTIDTTSSNSSGACGPSGTQDCRGADSVAELNRQRERASIVVCSLNADIYGLMELENTTPSDTITDLLGAINARCGGAHPYTFVNTGGTLGTDAIRVQLIYRTGVVSPVGSPLVDLDPIHNRPPTAQTFDVVDATNPAFGERFTVVANHFKSKGCDASATGANADAGDGQSCYNGQRTQQAARLLTWITSTVLPAAGDPDVLLLGDFNSYAQEDPVTTIASGGFTDLETLFHGANAYSYLFSGQLGHLDYGFANTSLLAKVTGADAWHINADEVDLFDYNDEVKDTGESSFEEKPDGSSLVPPRVVFQPASPYRASDHDPVIIGLFPVADLAITKTDGVTTAVPGGSVTYTITASNAGPDPATGATVADTFPAVLTCIWTCVGAGGGTCTASGSGNINDTVNLPVGGSVTYTATCAINASATGTLSNTATVSGGGVSDSNPANNSATDTDTLTPQADLAITKTDGVTTATPGGSVTYTITASNAGPSNAPGATVADTFPASLTCTWTCVGAGGGTCTASGSGNINDTVNLPAGGSVTYTASCAILVTTTGTLSNTATVMAPAGVTDPNSGNNSATDTTTVEPPAILTLGNRVFLDRNRDGILNGADAGINSVALSLFVDSNNDNVPDGAAIATTTTSGGGFYTFPGLLPGNYIVRIDASNFSGGGALFGLFLTTFGGDPDNDINHDSNGLAGAGGSVVSQAITLSINGEPTNDGDADNNTNLTLDFGFQAPNQAPTILALNGDSVSFTQGGSAVKLDAGGNAAINDPDSQNFDGGSLTVAITANKVAGEDQLGIMDTSGNFTVSGNMLLYFGTPIGTFTGGGAGGGDLVFSFNANADPNSVGRLLRVLTYFNSNTTNPSTMTRTITYTVVDGDGTANGGSDTGTATSQVTILATPGLKSKLLDPVVCNGPGSTVTVTAQVNNPNGTAQTASFSATLDAQLLAIPGSCTAVDAVTNAPLGTCTVNSASSVTWNATPPGTLGAGQTVTIQYQAQIANGTPQGTTLCVNSTAMVGTVPATPVQACTTLNCPGVGPGTPPPAAVDVNGQKPGSILFYNLYTSDPTNLNRQNTRINLTNTDTARSVSVHLFFVDGSNCSPADAFICLTPNQTMSFLASDFDPGTTGYIIAIASDPITGCPINFNFLIGDEFVKLTSGHQANLAAESIAAIAGAVGTAPLCPTGTLSVTLNFDGVQYNRIPKVLAVDNFPSRLDGNNTLLILNRFGGDLNVAGSRIGTIMGILYDEAEQPYSFTFVADSCQFRNSLSNNLPRILQGLDTVVYIGLNGWMRLWAGQDSVAGRIPQVQDVGLFGAMINFNTGRASANANQGHNLHKLTFTTTNVTLTIPIIVPAC